MSNDYSYCLTHKERIYIVDRESAKRHKYCEIIDCYPREKQTPKGEIEK